MYAAFRQAATCHDGVEELVDVEEITEEDKRSLGGFLALRKLKVASTEWSELLKVRCSSTA